MSKISRQARFRDNKILNKVEESDESILSSLKIEESDKSNELEENILSQEELIIISNSIITNNITFDPIKHRIQGSSKKTSDLQYQYYLKHLWTSVTLNSTYCISFKVKNLFIGALYNNPDFKISSDFFSLINTIINKIPDSNSHKKRWIALGKSLNMKGEIKREEVRKYLKLKWKNFEINNANIKTLNPEEINIKKIEYLKKAKEFYNSIDQVKELEFRLIEDPICIVDSNKETLIHLEQLNDDDAVVKAKETIDNYYFHTLNNPTHRSQIFWSNFIEHFGAFRSYSQLPYTSSNLASSHNIDHLECVNKLINAIQPLTNCINQFIKNNYEDLYKELNQLSLGPFVPKSFGIFPIITINYNIISNYHWDINDEKNCFCALVALGNYEGGELCFPQLKLYISLKPGQIIIFRSSLLLHGNFKLTKGIRHSIVYYVHSDLLKNNTDDDYIKVDDIKVNDNIISDLYNAQGLNNLIRLTNPKNEQITESFNNINSRRNSEDILRARYGLKVEDFSNSK
jgi:hypothetical protein